MKAARLRQQYLQAMGVQAWVTRESAAPPAPAATPTLSTGGGALDNVVGQMNWDALQRHVSDCALCDLRKTCTQTVFGVGNHSASWMIIGEAPGAEEDRQGEPFVGRAGQLLNEMLRAIGIERGAAYIANVLKCRPPGNRDPRPEEVLSCEPYLRRQVDLIQPKIILAVGRIAAQSLIKTDNRIGALRGRVYRYADTGIPLVVTYHPAYLLRSPLEKRKAWEDLRLAERAFTGSAG